MAGVTLVGTSLVMLLGAYTSAIGAGLSCPDWPTCYGTWVPFLQPEIIADSPVFRAPDLRRMGAPRARDGRRLSDPRDGNRRLADSP